ncbi:DNA-binding protein, partial [Dysosmobacter welbionis]
SWLRRPSSSTSSARYRVRASRGLGRRRRSSWSQRKAERLSVSRSAAPRSGMAPWPSSGRPPLIQWTFCRR